MSNAGVVTVRTRLAIKGEPLTNRFFNRVIRSMRRNVGCFGSTGGSGRRTLIPDTGGGEHAE